MALGATLAFVVGCDEPPPPLGAYDGGSLATDGGADGSTATDASTAIDASLPGCEVRVREIVDAATGDELEFDVTGGASAFEVVYTEHDPAHDPTRNAFFVRVPFGAAPSPAVPALAAGDEQRLGQPVVRASGEGFVSVCSQTFDAAYDLSLVRLDASSSIAAGPTDLTSTPTTADTHPALLEVGASGFLLAYVVESLSMGSLVETPMLETLDALGASSGAPKAIVGMGDVRGALRLHALGGGAKLAWRDSGSIFRLATIAADGTLGTVRAISEPSEVAVDFDFAAGTTGGVAVYDVALTPSQSALRLRVLDSDGAPVGGERDLLGGSRRGVAPALASGPGGYVVAYRGSDDGTHWSLRLAFVDASSYAVVRDEAVAALVTRAGRVRIGAESGGRLLVVWDDARDGAPGVRLRAAELDCH
ncbi:MAG: hypothetical protein U0230_12570 [Polyangiales bacterium]